MEREKSAQRAAATIREAAANGADLVIFSETWLPGYPYWTEGWDSSLPDWAAGRIRLFDESVLVPSEATETIARAARDARVHVVMGCNEIDPRPGNGTIYNSLLFFDRSGRLYGRHRKLMPTFIERVFWGSGDGNDLEVYETDIGRIGGLVCGENLMTPVRASLIAMGEDIHIAAFPGAFSLDVGPRVQEWDISGRFWGHFTTRSHALESGAFVCCVCAYVDPKDVAADAPNRERLYMDWARGGSQVVSPLGMPMVGPVEGRQLIYADCEARLIKAVKAIVDTLGHYGRADAVRVQVRRDDEWRVAGESYAASRLPQADLQRAADAYDVSLSAVEEVADERKLAIAKGRRRRVAQ
jgi:predicted amidohydrolase